jgi:magnesium-transporting ATPase (P-type)
MFKTVVMCESGQLEYQAQSPDEAALVNAARNFGFVFKVCRLLYVTLNYMPTELLKDKLRVFTASCIATALVSSSALTELLHSSIKHSCYN